MTRQDMQANRLSPTTAEADGGSGSSDSRGSVLARKGDRAAFGNLVAASAVGNKFFARALDSLVKPGIVISNKEAQTVHHTTLGLVL